MLLTLMPSKVLRQDSMLTGSQSSGTTSRPSSACQQSLQADLAFCTVTASPGPSEPGTAGRRPAHPSRSVPVAVSSLSKLLRERPARALAQRQGILQLLAGILRSGGASFGAVPCACLGGKACCSHACTRLRRLCRLS